MTIVAVIFGIFILFGIIGGLGSMLSWSAPLPRNPTVGQQVKAMSVEFFGKLLMLATLAFASFIIWKALSS